MIVPNGLLHRMRRQSLAEPDAGTWYAYSNVAFDSAALGETRYLRCGPGCTLKTPPSRHPDVPGPNGVIGWKYALVGAVDLVTGLVEGTENASKGAAEEEDGRTKG
jgi:hypothetical protein